MKSSNRRSFLANGSKRSAKCLGAVAESADHRVGGGGELGGCALKADAALVEERNTVAGHEGLGHIVGDDEGGKIKLPLVLGDHGKDRVAAQGIEARGR